MKNVFPEIYSDGRPRCLESPIPFTNWANSVHFIFFGQSKNAQTVKGISQPYMYLYNF